MSGVFITLSTPTTYAAQEYTTQWAYAPNANVWLLLSMQIMVISYTHRWYLWYAYNFWNQSYTTGNMLTPNKSRKNKGFLWLLSHVHCTDAKAGNMH